MGRVDNGPNAAPPPSAVGTKRLDRRKVLRGVATGLAVPAGLALAGPPAGRGAAPPAAPPERGYASVNGLEMYYELHGTPAGVQAPLVLLHGAFGTIDLWGPILETLAATRQVIAIEQQAHGHTADVDRPLRYEQMADDTAALLRQIGIDNADVFGYSMGGATALRIAIQHPGLVRKLVLAAPYYSNDGIHPEILALEETMKAEDFAGSPPHEAYTRTAPDPAGWPTLVAKVKELDLGFAGWPPDAIRAIAAPALIIIGDSDAVRPEHAVELFRLLGGGVPGDLVGLPRSQLAVLPGTTHVSLVVERADWLISMITPFLDAPMPAAT